MKHFYSKISNIEFNFQNWFLKTERATLIIFLFENIFCEHFKNSFVFKLQ